ncbi:MAG TPA: site-specific integrase, partial [Candidatus Angelobacter sp.]|nr:site-specific integrase [Candidatus Angelobacter sp.]
FTIEVSSNRKPKNHPHTDFPVGHWELRRYQGSKLKYDRLPEMGIQDALLQRRQLENTLIDNHGVLPETEPDKLTLKQLCDDFMKVKNAEGVGRDSIDGYQLIIDEFLASCNRRYPENVTALDVLNYCASIEQRGLSPRTRSNRFVSLSTIFTHCGINPKMLLTKQQRKVLSDYPQLDPVVYDREEVMRLLSNCDDYHKVVYYFLYRSGFRKQEAMYLEWTDINFIAKTLSVRMKKHIGFEPKKCKERTVPMFDDLADVLLQWREHNPNTRFVLGNSNDRPNTHWWDDLQDITKKAGMLCGSCSNCVSGKGSCEKWFLHAFRATFVTERFEEGKLSEDDIKFIIGHSDKDSESIRRYKSLAKMRRGVSERMNGGVR